MFKLYISLETSYWWSILGKCPYSVAVSLLVVFYFPGCLLNYSIFSNLHNKLFLCYPHTIAQQFCGFKSTCVQDQLFEECKSLVIGSAVAQLPWRRGRSARRPASVGAARVLRPGVSYMQWQCVPYDGDQLVPVDWDLDLNLELTAGPRTKLHRYLSEGHNDLFRTMHPPRRSSTMTLHDRSTTLYSSFRQIKRNFYRKNRQRNIFNCTI